MNQCIRVGSVGGDQIHDYLERIFINLADDEKYAVLHVERLHDCGQQWLESTFVGAKWPVFTNSAALDAQMIVGIDIDTQYMYIFKIKAGSHHKLKGIGGRSQKDVGRQGNGGCVGRGTFNADFARTAEPGVLCCHNAKGLFVNETELLESVAEGEIVAFLVGIKVLENCAMCICLLAGLTSAAWQLPSMRSTSRRKRIIKIQGARRKSDTAAIRRLLLVFLLLRDGIY